MTIKRVSRTRPYFPGPGLIMLLSLFALAGCPSTDSLYRAAYEHYIWNEQDAALEILGEILEKDGTYVPAYVLESLIRTARGEDEMALAALESAKQAAAPSAVVSFNLGNILFKKGEYGRACSEYSQAIALKPDFSEAFLNRANSLMMLREYPAALNDYETFLRLSVKDNPDVKKLVSLLRVEFGGAD